MVNENGWKVTENSLESTRPYEYVIEAKRLTEMDQTSGLYSWPRQLAEKTWIDYEEFAAAYRAALSAHAAKHKLNVDQDLLERSIARGREIAAKVASYRNK